MVLVPLVHYYYYYWAWYVYIYIYIYIAWYARLVVGLHPKVFELIVKAC